MKYTFDAYKEDGSPRKFAGMFRPPYLEVFETLKENNKLLYYRRSYIYDFSPEYNMGKFDKPIYEDD